MRRPISLLGVVTLVATLVIATLASPAAAAEISSSGWQWPTGSVPVVVAGGEFLGNGCGTDSQGLPNGTALGGYGFYSNGDYHIGDDQSASFEAEVKPIGPGTIKLEWPNFGDDGGAVIVEHTDGDGNDFVVVYGHLKERMTSGNVTVTSVLGKVNTDHVHLGVNPGPYTSFPSSDWGNLDCNNNWESGNSPLTTNGFEDPIPWLEAHPADEPSVSSSAGSLIENGGFETSGPQGWTEVHGGSTEDTYRTGSVYYEGGFSHRVDGNGSFSRIQNYETVDASSSNSFVATVMARSVSGTETAKVQLHGLSGGTVQETEEVSVTGGTGWELLRVPITLSGNRDQLRIDLIAPSDSEVFFDSASVTKSLIINGGFETSGPQGWTEEHGGSTEDTYRTGAYSFDGSYSHRIDGNGSYSQVENAVTFDSDSGDSFVTEAMIRAVSGSETAKLRVLGTGGSQELATTEVTVGTTWTYVRVSITMTSSHTGLEVQLIAPGGNQLNVDSVSLTQSQIENGGFETSGPVGWSEVQGSGCSTEQTFRTAAQSFDETYSHRVDGGGCWMRVQNVVDVDASAGDSFIAVVMARSVSGTEMAKVQLHGLGTAQETETVQVSVGTRWTVLRVPITLSVDRDQLRVDLIAPTGSEVFFDSVSLT